MLRSLAVLLAVALLGASPNKTPGVHGGRVHDLVGTWTCRNPAGVISTVVYSEENGDVVAEEKTPGASAVVRDRFRKDPSGGWLVERDTGFTHFSGYAPAWTADPWVITDSQKHGTEIRYERVGDGTLWRTFRVASYPPYAGEVCAKGDVPPDPALCAVPDVPAFVLRATEPDTPVAAMQAHITGRVEVLVSLDAAGHVVDATIAQSPSTLLNAASLAAARSSTYRAALHDCKPVPSQYRFAVEYTGG
ncbi:MAG TPA: energy transducer TonB [Dongiaceae bacterium]|nr:energy transducer TonB [Dongiaceae bacterium]